jgi:FKBP-type peptidyl-prolyl cis-trans isomerase (trigger factor)
LPIAVKAWAKINFFFGAFQMAKETEAQTETKDEIKNIVEISDAGPCKKKISIEIPAEKITKALDEQYEQLRKDAIIPGFRKGRAPRRLLEKRFGKESSEQVKLKLMMDSAPGHAPFTSRPFYICRIMF